MYRSNIIEIFIGLLVLIGAVSIGIVAFNKLPYKNTFRSCYTVKALFSNVDGLDIGDEVTISGVKIGTVNSISLTEKYIPTVTMCLQKGILLPLDSSASILNSNMLGKKHIDIELGSEQEIIPNEGVIEHTHSDLSFNTIIAKVIDSLMK
ncbi:outer membrane lipid asymmetry maintenance protein MlaD [Ehrlichia ruminantium]|uniref:Outer membrane lipid asymmetry maintenance protein MlaD n=1 Tax=Ehrlichia ruminantium TaxID=779 RepID=A0AAE6UKG5_EHRRU|nr:outer membrane lipid asymmetry maintenance protein MlaD [Ehrlichia ruminantium]QGR02211.1 outer membrane lipid asymmetry maintenance protein MlaD [Ehrlichia ruminantium]QGR03133.1 outer membrane lipid asymmetry maintenance protein MlaD [Ehrlichia ruminantium]QGR04058.1 outer membrane lipid asymmetry maintenance protein MlaD [Ehrlichia ruminantium]